MRKGEGGKGKGAFLRREEEGGQQQVADDTDPPPARPRPPLTGDVAEGGELPE